MRSFSLFLLAFLLMCVNSFGDVGDVWDAKADWSDINNPNVRSTQPYGIWSYHDIDNGQLLLATPAGIGRSPGGWSLDGTDNSVPILFDDDWAPGGGHNPDEFAGHGPWMVRWTSPFDGVVAINGTMWQKFETDRQIAFDLRQNEGTPFASDYIPEDGLGDTILGRGGTIRFGPIPRLVKIGDTIDFLVDGSGPGGNGAPTFAVVTFWIEVIETSILYVDTDARGDNDGTNWDNAYVSLQDALFMAGSGSEIRVAEGMYKPNQGRYQTPGDRTVTFQLKHGVTIKGGYAGFNEPDPNERNIEHYPTILSGDLSGNDKEVSNPTDLLTEPTRSDNCYHVVTGSYTDITTIIDGFTITAGTATDRNGGGMFTYNGNPTIANCVFTRNSASGFGGGIWNEFYSSPTVSNCLFSANSSYACGGGMANWDNSSPNLNECAFNGNIAQTAHGGGIYNWGDCNPSMNNCTFSQNIAQGSGGGMWNENYSSPNITYCLFQNNSAVACGGGIANMNYCNPNVSNCSFNENSAEDSHGGGIYNANECDPIVTNCTFNGNSVGWGGGGMWNENDSNPIITDCTFTDNTARNGGGVENWNNSSPTLNNCSFSGNSAETYGGGMHNNNSEPVVIGCTFIKNWTSGKGGGIYNVNSNPTLTDCVFNINGAQDAGGGVRNSYKSNPELINCTFSGNYTTHGSGGGMSNKDSNPTLTDCAFIGNSAQGDSYPKGGGLHLANGSNTILTNCTFLHNSAGWSGGAVAGEFYCTTLMTNCLFADNSSQFAGAIDLWDNTSTTLHNCTVVANLASINGGGMNVTANCAFTLNNCIVWANTDRRGSLDVMAQIHDQGGGTINVEYSCIQDFDPHDENVYPGAGNIDDDPLFADPADGDYHLKSRRGRWDPSTNDWSGGWVLDRLHSTCIDNGKPGDPVGDEPAPNGNRINMGAFGGTALAGKSWTTVGGDLVVTEVTVDELELAGQPFHVSWSVINVDPVNTVYAWFFDAVYLSTDAQWDADDILLETVWREDTLDPGQSYQADACGKVPGVLPDNYYILVRTDLGDHVEEPGGEDNNITATDAFFIDVEELLVGSTIGNEFNDSDRMRYYRTTVIKGKDLEINLDDLDDNGANELYVSYEAIPTRSSFDFRYQTNFAPDQTIRIPGTQAGTYYILAYAGNIPGAVPSIFNLNIAYLPQEIYNVTPDHSGNTEYCILTVAIDGSRFDPNSIVLLRRNGEADIFSTDITFVDSGSMYAQFNFHGAAAGMWDLTMTSPGLQPATFPFNVIEGGEPNLVTQLILPDALGYHRRAVLWIEYANIGDAPMPAPLLKLHGSEDALLTADESLNGPGLWTKNPPAGLTDIVQVLALGSGEDPGVLNPGDSGRIPIYWRGSKLPWNFSYPAIEFDLGILEAGDDTPIDWTVVEAEVRPSETDPNIWDPMFTRLQTQIGSTWGEYVMILTNNAERLAAAGRPSYCVRVLLNMEMDEAYGYPTGIIAGNVVHNDTNEILGDLKIVALSTQDSGYAEDVTNSDGSFYLYGLPSGSYDFNVDGFIVQEGAEVYLETDVTGIEVRVVEAGELRGIVTGPDNQLIEGAWVGLVNSEGDSLGNSTDIYGQYHIGGIAMGDWELSVYDKGYVSPSPSTFTISTPGETKILDVTLLTGGMISGIVSNSDGVPIPDVYVFANTSRTTSRWDLTDSNGYYEIGILPQGECRINVRSDYYLSAHQVIPNLSEGEILENIDFILEEGALTFGYVRDAQTEEAIKSSVLVFLSEDDTIEIKFSDEQGRFAVSLIPGSYTVYVSALHYEDSEFTLIVPIGGFNDPLYISLGSDNGMEAMGLGVPENNMHLKFDNMTLAGKEAALTVVAEGFLVHGWARLGTPVAYRHLMTFILPYGHNEGSWVHYDYYYDSSSWVSQQAMKEDDITRPLWEVRNDVKSDIISKFSRSGAVSAGFSELSISGKVRPLNFETGLSYWGGDLFLAFGGMQEGEYSLYPLEMHIADGQCTITGTMKYTFMDRYNFRNDRQIIFLTRWADDLEQAGWATRFNTWIEIIEEDFSVSFKVKSKKPPKPPTKKNKKRKTRKVRSYDPNIKTGPRGSGSEGYITSDSLMVYTVYFENDPNATASALEVTIEDQLDADLDWTTFELLEIGFGDHQVAIPSGMTHYQTNMEIEGWTWHNNQGWHTGEIPLKIDIDADIDIATGMIIWNINSYDPVTGWEPEDAYAGFLPPDDPCDLTHRGEGYVSFLIRPKIDSPNGTRITNSASIIFDGNPAIVTPSTLNIIMNNRPPVAYAGKNQTVYTDPNGLAKVILDGSGSVDADRDKLTYKWSWTIDGETYSSSVGDGIINLQDFARLSQQQFQAKNTSANTAGAEDGNKIDMSALAEFAKAWLSTSGNANYNLQYDNAPDSPYLPIELPVGEYVITLIVNDGIVDSWPDEVVITVLRAGDLDQDDDVDMDDLEIVLAARNTPADGLDDPRDLDGDGMITVLDARILVTLFTD